MVWPNLFCVSTSCAVDCLFIGTLEVNESLEMYQPFIRFVVVESL